MQQGTSKETAEEEEGRYWWRDPASLATARDFALLSGIFKIADGDESLILPISLRPAKFPEDLFHKAVKLQTAINTIVDAISSDHEFLNAAFEK